MAYVKKEHIDQIVRVIVTTRDFCGDEVAAAIEQAREFGYDDNDAIRAHRIANFRANAEWNAHKKAAGVNPKHCF
jgi:hypothetical protein